MSKHAHEPSQLSVIARAPFNVYYEGVAEAVTAVNKVGKFDILPGHADFFSILNVCDVAIQTPSDVVTVPITNGIITVRDNEVMLFVNM